MESEEITKLVDGVYKNILEKFNPGARQLITAGKGYLKALHGAASASRMFNEALCKIAMNAQQSGTGDIGSALLNVVSVYKEIQDQQMNILKAFYVDLLVPLETNLEKDTKVVQHEQKKFMQQHKVRMESYHKAMSTMKKHRKKKNSPENTEKELRSLQMLEDQKKKLDVFCEQSYKHAMTQERRRYGFVLERQCSIAKHWISYHNTGKNVLENNVENWQEVASSREIVTATAYENNFAKRMERIKEDENHTGSSMLKKARSVDAPYGDMRTLNENNYSQNSLPRAKSDFNLTSSNINGVGGGDNWDQRPVVKSLYAYMPSGENQLPFAEGDKIALVGKKANGWQFGENLRTQMFGWFPIAYTNAEIAEKKYDRDNNYENLQYDRPSNGAGGGGGNSGMRYQEYLSDTLHDPSVESDSTYRRRNNSNEESSPTRMFGDTIMFRNQKKYRGISGANPRPGPPPTLPAPVPSGNNIGRMLNSSQSFCSPNGPPIIERRKHKNQNGGPTQGHVSKSMLNHINNHPRHPREGTAKTSLHSSNDSGFANEPPPQPEVDYSDEEHTNRVPIRRKTDASFKLPREIASWTLSRSFRNGNAASITDERNSQTPTSKLLANAKQSISFDNIVASDDEILQNSSGIKRTKSFWKFGKNDDILAGMSLWQHRDLVPSSTSTPIQNGNKSGSSARIGGERKISLNGTLTKSNSNRSIQSTNEQLRKDSVTSTDIFDDDENIYGIAPQRHHQQQQQQQQSRQYQNHHQTKYTPPSRMKIMKTIEIDIENPMEPGERVNTIKRDHRGAVSAAKQSQQQQQQQHQNIGNGMKKATSSKDDHQLKQKSTAAALLAQSKQSKMKLENELTNSSDDDHDHDDNGGQDLSDNENDDDDNGTLKMSDVNNFFEDMSQNGGNGGIIMKTVKRRDILKQYYTSEEDESEEAEVKSTSSDPYDCIVINDHLVRKDDKNRHQQQIYHKANNHKHNHHQHHHQQEQIMEFQTFRSVTQQQQQKLKTTMNNKNANNGSGSMNTKFNHSEQDRYNGSTLTRGGSSTANTSASTAITTATSTNHGGGNSMMMITPTATILPRTRLMKSSMNLKNGSGGNITTTNTNTNTSSISHTTLERNHKRNGNATTSEGGNKNDEKDNKHFVKTYGPWYDFWEHQDQLTSSSVKSSSTMPKSKMLMK